jgi:hypothetical protein
MWNGIVELFLADLSVWKWWSKTQLCWYPQLFLDDFDLTVST